MRTLAGFLLAASLCALATAARANHICTNSPNEVFVGMSPPGPGVAAVPLCRWVTPPEPEKPAPKPTMDLAHNHGAMVRHAQALAPWNASGYADARSARNAAQEACTAVMGSGCRVLHEVRNAVAVAAVREDGEYLIAADSREPGARERALSQCRAQGKPCDLVYVLSARLELTPAGRGPTFKPKVDNLNNWPSEVFAANNSKAAEAAAVLAARNITATLRATATAPMPMATNAVVYHPGVKWLFINKQADGPTGAAALRASMGWCRQAMRDEACRHIGDSWVNFPQDTAQAVGIALREDGERFFEVLQSEPGKHRETRTYQAAAQAALRRCKEGGFLCTVLPISAGVDRPIDFAKLPEYLSQMALAAWPTEGSAAGRDVWIAQGFTVKQLGEAEEALLGACKRESGHECKIHRRVTDTSLLIYRAEAQARLGVDAVVADNGTDAYRVMQQPAIPEPAVVQLLQAEIDQKLQQRCGGPSPNCSAVRVINAQVAQAQVLRISPN